MKIFITGGSGMLGQVLVKHFTNCIAPSQEEFDLLKPSHAFSRCDVIIHCAAMTVVDACEKNQDLCKLVNVDGTAAMVKLARRWNAKLFFISTPMVFSGTRGDYREHDRTLPINYYGWTKREGERAVLAYRRGTVIRSNPIGIRPAHMFPSFIQWFVDAAQSNRSFDLFSDVRVNPVSTKTLTVVLRSLIQRSIRDNIIHVGSRDIANKADIWEFIVKRFPNFNGVVRRTSVDDTRVGKATSRPKEMWLNVDRIQKQYGIAMPSWRNEVGIVLKELGI